MYTGGRPSQLRIMTFAALRNKLQYLAIRPIHWVLALSVLHGMLYAVVTPPWQAPDETVHYQYLRALWQSPEPLSPFFELSPEAHQQVMESARRFRWWFLTERATPDTLTPLPPGARMAARSASLYYRLSLPIYGVSRHWPIESQLLLLRLFSVMLQVLTVGLTYKVAQLISPAAADPFHSLLPAAAALIVGLFPQYTFISASYNDDNLLPVLAAAAVYAALCGWRNKFAARWLILAGVFAVLAVLTKRTGVSVIVVVGAAALIYAWVWQGSKSQLLRLAGLMTFAIASAVLLGGVALLVIAPVLPEELARFARVQTLAVVRLREFLTSPSEWGSFDWSLALQFFLLSFWGWFGWLKAPLWPELMDVLGLITALVCIGFGVRWAMSAARRSAQPTSSSFWLGATGLLAVGLLANFGLMVLQMIVNPQSYALVGRYIFPFMCALGVLGAYGWQAWFPPRWQASGLALGVTLLAVFDLIAIGLIMVPFYYQ